MGFYDEMADVVTEILSDPDFKQGTVYLIKTTRGVSNIATPWLPAAETTQQIELDSVTRRVDERYVDGSTILMTDNMVTFAVPSVTPSMTDRLMVDGRIYLMKGLVQVPAAGTPVAYIAFIGNDGG